MSNPIASRPAPHAPKRRSCGVVGVALVVALAAGCADAAVTGKGPNGRGAKPPVESTLADGGWIGGAPAMDEAIEGASPDVYASKAAGPALSTVDGADASGSAREAPTSPDGSSPLRAGNIDDNAAFDDYLAYLARIATSGVPFRPMDPTGRVVITVADDDGTPIAGAPVEVSEGQRRLATLRTTADGTTRFHPRAFGADTGPFTVSTGGAAKDVASGGAVTLRGESRPALDRIPLDIAFAIDTTGSMGDELERMKTSVASVVERIEALPGAPDIRLAMTVFRDEGDSFVTATHDFTTDVAEFRTALRGLEAGGGGDTPEALDEAIDEVLAKPAWRPAGEATQLVFVIGDASGHADRNVARAYTDSMKDAAERGIKIIPIAASATDDAAEVAFRQMAQFTGARFVFLAYGAGGAAVGSSTDIASTDYEELSLDDLIVRLVADELGARTGQPITIPTTRPTTTRPSGQ